MKHYLNQLGQKYILVGDFNAHSPLIETNCRSNYTGRTLEKIVLDGGLCLINPPDLYTYINPTSGRGSCLDLCFTTPNIAADTKIKLGTDVGSDHCTVEIDIQLVPIVVESIGVKKFKKSISKRELDQFSGTIAESSLIMPNSLDAVVEDLTNRIYDSAI